MSQHHQRRRQRIARRRKLDQRETHRWEIALRIIAKAMKRLRIILATDTEPKKEQYGRP